MEAEPDAVSADLARLKRRFDPLLDGSAVVLDQGSSDELRLLARIHDLDDNAPAILLWGALRGRLEALAPPPPVVEPRSWVQLDTAA